TRVPVLARSLRGASGCGRRRPVRVHGVTLERTCLIDDALEEATDGRVVERPAVRFHHVAEDFRLALRRPGWQIQFLLDVADLDRASRALVEQLHELLVNLVNALSPVVQLANWGSFLVLCFIHLSIYSFYS